MIKPLALPALLLPLFSFNLYAYNPADHKAFAADAAASLCAARPAGPFCAELAANLPFLLHGAVMEDMAAKGHKETFNGVEFRDEEKDAYGPCSEYVVTGKKYMYCNHYFFLESYLGGGPEGSCGSNMLGATNPDCGKKDHRWESARQRGLRLWKEKVMPYYTGVRPDGKARAYYWLGRVAHLLADVAVPAHDTPHKMGYAEFEHRAFEYEAGHVETGPLPSETVPADISALYTGLAGRTLEINAAVRAAECRRSPQAKGCEKMRATPTLPLESGGFVRDTLLTDAIMKGKSKALNTPEMKAERALARKQLALIKPLTVAHTARLLELFGAQAGLSAQDIEVAVEVPAGDAFEGRAVNFDGLR